MLIGTVAAYDIPGTLEVGILVAADISSADVGILALRIATALLPTGNYITRGYWYIKYEYSTQYSSTMYMLCRYEVVPGTCTYLYTWYLVGYRPTAACTVCFFSWAV